MHEQFKYQWDFILSFNNSTIINKLTVSISKRMTVDDLYIRVISKKADAIPLKDRTINSH
jgi:hypothetical protein